MESSHLVIFSASGKSTTKFNVLRCISLSETLFWTGTRGRIPITLKLLYLHWNIYILESFNHWEQILPYYFGQTMLTDLSDFSLFFPVCPAFIFQVMECKTKREQLAICKQTFNFFIFTCKWNFSSLPGKYICSPPKWKVSILRFSWSICFGIESFANED